MLFFFKYFQLRKAIEDVNSNSFIAQSSQPKDDSENQIPCKEPLLNSTDSDKNVNTTISSMNSTISNSENCSDIELESMNRRNAEK